MPISLNISYGGAKMVSCIDTAFLATQPLTVEQVRPAQVCSRASAAQAVDGHLVQRLSCVAFRQEGSSSALRSPEPNRYRWAR